MKILLVETILTKFSRVKDGSVNLSFRTQREISNEEFSLMDQYFQQPGFLAFKMDEVDLTDIPDTNTDIPGAKSPSVRLRTALFAKHMNTGGTKETFAPYYNRAMEGFIAAVNDSYDTQGER